MVLDRQALMEKAVRRGKYAPLFEFLHSLRGCEWHVSFTDIEKLLGFSLPDSARVHRPWWANQGEKGGHSHAMAWFMAGWKTAQVDLVNETLVFKRDIEN